MESVEVAVMGAGVIGLAVARELVLAGHEVIVLEANTAIGQETSSRNSEVVHAGIYYPSGSLKAELCVKGKDLLYRYCAQRGIACRRLGKLIVAQSLEQQRGLQRIQQQALACGVNDLQWLTVEQLRECEPAIQAEAALLSPSTGVIDSHALMLSLQSELEQAGGGLVLDSPVLSGRLERDGVVLQIGGNSRCELKAAKVINAAGLQALPLARQLSVAENLPQPHYARGHYFALNGKSPFSQLIYPLPEPGGLGIHVTLDMVGQARFGPDVQWIDKPDYRFDESRKPAFVEAIRRYYPALDETRLQPAYAGIRSKLAGPGTGFQDFDIRLTGDGRMVYLLGIESPGLTASLAIAERVNSLVS